MTLAIGFGGDVTAARRAAPIERPSIVSCRHTKTDC
jgi:hypothetical protein